MVEVGTSPGVVTESVNDLLSPESTTNLHIRYNAKKEAYVENVTYVDCPDANTALRILNDGIKNRTVTATAMNRESSRSHSLFSLLVE